MAERSEGWNCVGSLVGSPVGSPEGALFDGSEPVVAASVVAADAAVVTVEHVANLPGERWVPSSTVTAHQLRTPTPGTLEALVHRRGAAFV